MKSVDLLQRRSTCVIAEEEQSPQSDKNNDNYTRALRENDINIQNCMKLDPPVFTLDTNWMTANLSDLK